MARTPREKPNQLTASWPDVASPDPVGEVARQFVLNLVRAVGERGIRSVARDGGVDEGDFRHVLAGDSWPGCGLSPALKRAFRCAVTRADRRRAARGRLQDAFQMRSHYAKLSRAGICETCPQGADAPAWRIGGPLACIRRGPFTGRRILRGIRANVRWLCSHRSVNVPELGRDPQRAPGGVPNFATRSGSGPQPTRASRLRARFPPSRGCSRPRHWGARACLR